MKLIIEIPEVYYESLRKTDVIISGQRSGKTLMSGIFNAVTNGIPLPKGHGRLIDENDLWFEDIDDISCVTQRNVENAPTIIEADKAESEEQI